ncbi:MAG TPA: hypothetical protein VL284_09550 [Thermoanaerobaculia bacterium]|nr:hypothetical protein [Thermoanaerobaculia bacterium]
MGLFGPGDPTKDWPVSSAPIPEINSVLMQFDALRFGAPLEAARFLGRPDRFEKSGKKAILHYSGKGLRLTFTDDVLSEVAFLIGAASPSAPDGTRLTPETDKEAIVKLFGEPDPDGSDDICLQIFHDHGMASDFYIDERGRLTEWALYPSE